MIPTVIHCMMKLNKKYSKRFCRLATSLLTDAGVHFVFYIILSVHAMGQIRMVHSDQDTNLNSFFIDSKNQERKQVSSLEVVSSVEGESSQKHPNVADDDDDDEESHQFFISSGRTFDHNIFFESPWTYTCDPDESVCKRTLANDTTIIQSLQICWLTCGAYGPLWPYPTLKSQMGKETEPFYSKNVEISAIYAPRKLVKDMLGFAGNNFLDTLFNTDKYSTSRAAVADPNIENNVISITLSAQSKDIMIDFDTDESYSLTINRFQQGTGTHILVSIMGETYFGVRHGLETLSQLIAYDEVSRSLRIVGDVIIEDRPAFKYRGVMIDTSRNYLSINSIKRVINAMSYNKMNMLHWHMTDTNSFPFYTQSVPKMAEYGAYSSEEIYTPRQVKNLVLYARVRGVKVIPELDAPAHAGNGWQWGPKEGMGHLALCVNKEPWRTYCGQPPCGQLNPLNNYTYTVLELLYKDFLDVFDRDVFHMGGDEVYFQCWYYDDEIRRWQREKNVYDLMELWGLFQEKAFEKLRLANGGKYITPIVWTSEMTRRGQGFLDPKNYVVQIWTGSSSNEIGALLERGYRMIFSNLDSLYLDHGFGTWLGKDHFWTYRTWQEIYDNDLIRIAEYHVGANSTYNAVKSSQILGAEATLFGEKVDENNLEMKLWPRTSALAERLWSSPEDRNDSVYARLLHHRARMVSRGIQADKLQPDSCHQLSGYCLDPYSIL